MLEMTTMSHVQTCGKGVLNFLTTEGAIALKFVCNGDSRWQVRSA